MWLLDASVILAREDPEDAHHQDAVRLMASETPFATLDLAYYEVSNVAIRSWQDPEAAARLRERMSAIADDGGLVRADVGLLSSAADIAQVEGISLYDAAYVAAAQALRAELVSCDLRDLVSRGLARLPGESLG